MSLASYYVGINKIKKAGVKHKHYVCSRPFCNPSYFSVSDMGQFLRDPITLKVGIIFVNPTCVWPGPTRPNTARSNLSIAVIRHNPTRPEVETYFVDSVRSCCDTIRLDPSRTLIPFTFVHLSTWP